MGMNVGTSRSGLWRSRVALAVAGLLAPGRRGVRGASAPTRDAVESAARRLRSIEAIGRQALLAVAGSLFVSLCAQVAVYLPFSPVPVTGQTFGVLVVGALLGSRLGAAALLLYLAEGAVGLPVFSPGPTWGLARLLSPSGGYLLGFVASAWLVGRLGEAGWHRRLGTAVLSLLLGSVAIYVGGLVGLAIYFPLDKAVAVGVLPFLVGDALKVLVALGVIVGQRPLAWR